MVKKLFIYKGSSKSGKTGQMLENLEKIHRNEGPDTYIFLGASGGHIRSVRERFLEIVGSIFNDQFKVIDQFVVEKIKEIEIDKTHVSSDFIAAISTDLVSDNSSLGELMKKGNGISNAFLKFYSLVKERKEEFMLAEIESSENAILKEFVGIYRKFQKEFESLNLYSTQDAYNIFSSLIRDNNISDLEIEEKNLFIDGFLDISEILLYLFLNLSFVFENIHIAFPVDESGKYIDDSFGKFYDRLISLFPDAYVEEIDCDKNSIRGELQLYFDAVEKNGKYDASKLRYGRVEFLDSRNVYEEVYSVCSYVKYKILIEGYSPEEVAVVVRDNKKYGELISKVFEEMHVPCRFDGDEMLLNSININRLILPFKTFYSGFSPEYLMMMVESGYTDNSELSLEDFRSVASDAGLYDAKMIMFDEMQWPKNLESRKDEWNKKLERYGKFLKEKRSYSENSADRDDISEALDRRIEITERVKKTTYELFRLLGMRFSSQESRYAVDYDNYFREDYDMLISREMISFEESEKNAVEVLFDNLLPEISRLIFYLGRKNHGKLSPIRYWKYLKIMLETASYKKSSLIDNRVMILDVENARFRNKKIKVYVGMTDKYYPKIGLDDFLLDIPISDSDLKDEIIRRDFRDFIFSLRNTSECILFSKPLADLNGRPIFPSIYLKRLADTFGEDLDNRKADPRFGEYHNYSKQAFMKKLLLEEKIDWRREKETGRIFKMMDLDFDRIKKRSSILKDNIENSYKIDIRDTETNEALINIFGSTLSASRYKTIKECGRKFYLQNLLKVPTDDIRGFGFHPFEEGSILHAVLYKTFRIISDEGVLLEEMEEIKVRGLLENEVRKFVESEVKGRIYHQSAILLELESERILGIVENFFNRYRNEKAKNNPGKFEKSFYSDVRFYPAEFEIEIEEHDNVKVYDKPEICLIGKIDRIDKSDSGYEFIIDYKSSDNSTSKSKMQLFLYALARSVGRVEGTVAGMTFMSLKSATKSVAKQFYLFNPDEGKYENKSSKGKDDKSSLSEFSEILRKDLAKIFSGELNYLDESNCLNCSFSKNGSCNLRSGEARMKI